MNFTIKKLSDDCDTKIRVRNFLFSQIRSEYGYGYIPSWHKDIVDLNKYYIDCRKNNLFFVENNDDGRIIASMAIRQYDKDFPEFRDIYS
ncbi:MAG: GNAT family N-acetyltransferase, partial [Methanobrevibacter sp.]|nr:GNAT family N-acetyltransferase [Methanobrevibacter sp.]